MIPTKIFKITKALPTNQLCTLLFGDTSNDDLKKRKDNTQEGDVDHMLTCGESITETRPLKNVAREKWGTH